MKKIMIFVLVAIMMLALVACESESTEAEETAATEETAAPAEETAEETEAAEEPVAEEGKVLNIYCWNDEFQGLLESYYDMPEDVEVNWIITPSTDNAYQNKLDEALLAQADVADDEKMDLFLIEADYAIKYVNTPYTLDVINEVGLSEDDVAGMYQYTKDICTADGALKGVSWQACPGGLIYRRSIAEAVLGSSEPDDVQAALSDWDKFDAVAADAKAAGYFMVSGFDDDFRVFSNNVSQPWVTDDKITVDASVERWVDQTKLYTDESYNNKASLWSAESWAGAKEDGKVMCYFGPGWFIDYCLAPQTKSDSEGPNEAGNGSYGDWGMVKGPQGFFWGGTWICAAAGSDNLSLVKDIMYTMTCDAEIADALAKNNNNFSNNVAVMEALAEDETFGNAFLGGQNNIGQFLDSAQSISMANIGPYDQGMVESYQEAFKEYFDGTVDKETAMENFYTDVMEKYPNLTK